MKVPTALRAQILRTAGPACSLLGVPRPIASKETCRRWARAQRRVRLRAAFVCARVLCACTTFRPNKRPHPTPPRGRKVLRTTVNSASPACPKHVCMGVPPEPETAVCAPLKLPPPPRQKKTPGPVVLCRQVARLPRSRLALSSAPRHARTARQRRHGHGARAHGARDRSWAAGVARRPHPWRMGS